MFFFHGGNWNWTKIHKLQHTQIQHVFLVLIFCIRLVFLPTCPHGLSVINHNQHPEKQHKTTNKQKINKKQKTSLNHSHGCLMAHNPNPNATALSARDAVARGRCALSVHEQGAFAYLFFVFVCSFGVPQSKRWRRVLFMFDRLCGCIVIYLYCYLFILLLLNYLLAYLVHKVCGGGFLGVPFSSSLMFGARLRLIAYAPMLIQTRSWPCFLD